VSPITSSAEQIMFHRRSSGNSVGCRGGQLMYARIVSSAWRIVVIGSSDGTNEM
jgi:hypothetical protein